MAMKRQKNSFIFNYFNQFVYVCSNYHIDFIVKFIFFFFFFFKHKTAYEISECDWSSDVCSSDLKQKTAYENSSHIQKSRMPSSASDRKSTRLNSSHIQKSRMPSSA